MANTISAIITAGGNAVRFGSNKMITLLKGKPLIVHTLERFHQIKSINEIILLVKNEEIKLYQNIINKEGFKVKLVPAAPERITSLYFGIKLAKGKYVITHDGNRPLTPVRLINRVAKEVVKFKAVITAVKPTATIKYSDGNFVKLSLPRNETWIAQTPQGFERILVLKALKKAVEKKQFFATDDSEFVTKIGHRVKIIPGDDINIKITFPQDLIIAEQLLNLSIK